MAEQRCLQSAASSLEGGLGGTRGLDLAHHLGKDYGHAIHVAVRGHILSGLIFN